MTPESLEGSRLGLRVLELARTGLASAALWLQSGTLRPKATLTRARVEHAPRAACPPGETPAALGVQTRHGMWRCPLASQDRVALRVGGRREEDVVSVPTGSPARGVSRTLGKGPPEPTATTVCVSAEG